MSFISHGNELINLYYVKRIFLSENIIRIVYDDVRWDDLTYDTEEIAKETFEYLKRLLASNMRDC